MATGKSAKKAAPKQKASMKDLKSKKNPKGGLTCRKAGGQQQEY